MTLFLFTLVLCSDWFDYVYLQIQDNWPSVLFALAGGVGLSIGNLATQYALAFVGLSVTEVTTASITVVIGVQA